MAETLYRRLQENVNLRVTLTKRVATPRKDWRLALRFSLTQINLCE